jgi:hypothetical protein
MREMTRIEKVSDEEAPALRHLMRWFSPSAEVDFIDPDEPVEWALDALPEQPELGTLDDLLAQIGRELGAYPEEEDLSTRLAMKVFTPTAGTWRAWWEYLLEWMPQVWANPVLDPRVHDTYPLPRASRFTDQETANRSVTEVLGAHEQRFREWAGDTSGPRRLHLYADLGREIGRVVARGADGRPSDPQPARAVAVTMSRLADSEQVVVAAAYPELVLASTARDRLPDLPGLFGAYFGQDYASLDHHRWRAEWRFNTRATPRQRQLVAGQLLELLAEHDADLLADVEALGSYVLPVQLRRWVTGLHRRITVPDWTLPAGFVDPVNH